ncbi:MAG: cysteine rich repeat-containing protein [Bacteriovoracaceae bacterium]|nr:cysteine rich repeat-containing protein [Bacteriovoracaceae bacterium]
MKYLLLLACVVSFSTMAEMGEGPCKEDREKFCKDVKPGGGAIAKCMKEHKDSFSAACKEKWEEKKEEMKEKREKMKDACEEDMTKHCPDMKGKERMKCMKEKEADLSEGCKATMPKMKKKWK